MLDEMEKEPVKQSKQEKNQHYLYNIRASELLGVKSRRELWMFTQFDQGERFVCDVLVYVSQMENRDAALTSKACKKLFTLKFWIPE